MALGRGAWALAVVMAGALSACVSSPAVSPRPLPAPVPSPTPALPAPASAESAAAHAYYAQVQQALLSQGLLRTDGGGADTPYTDRMLAETFVQIALRDEYQPGSGGALASDGASTRLRRWQGPVRVGLRFGASVPANMRATDTARVGSYLARLAQVTGHSIRLDDNNPNYFVYIVTEDERRALGPALQAAMPGLGAADVTGITQMPQSTYCAVLAQSRGQGVYSRAFAVVRAEHPDLLRLSCIHEEIAQGLGLPNDSPRARPSIFNDDEEFALLTRMDEAMLRILYNPALRPGMTEVEARPIIYDLATRMVGGAS